jgi:hypothetical protein
MNHFKSLKIGTNPLLVIGCILIAFSLTHFYFTNIESPKIAQIIGHIMLFPVYVFEEICNRIGFSDLTRNAIVVFLVLVFSYSCVVLVISKILKWIKSGN